MAMYEQFIPEGYVCPVCKNKHNGTGPVCYPCDQPHGCEPKMFCCTSKHEDSEEFFCLEPEFDYGLPQWKYCRLPHLHGLGELDKKDSLDRAIECSKASLRFASEVFDSLLDLSITLSVIEMPVKEMTVEDVRRNLRRAWNVSARFQDRTKDVFEQMRLQLGHLSNLKTNLK